MIKQLKQALLCAVLLTVAVLGNLATPQLSAAQATPPYFVTNVDPSQFPDVTFTLRALDIKNTTLTNLNNTSFTVYENGQAVPNITVTPRSDAPLNIVFVIDLGHFSNYLSFGFDNLRPAISSLVTTNGLFVEGRDTVQVLGRQNVNGDQTLELRHATNSVADLTNWLNAFTFPRSQANTKGLLGVTDALKAVSVLVPVPGSKPAAVILLTRYIEDPTKTTATTAAQALGSAAHNQFVPVYVLQTDTTNDAPLRALADNSNGIYVPLNRNNVASAVAPVYQTIAAQRGYYTVTYRSQAGTSGQRQSDRDKLGSTMSPSSNDRTASANDKPQEALRLEGRPHPRVFGSAGRVLGPLVREVKLFSLEEAVHKLSGYAASRFGLKQRGELKAGHFADVVLFDPNTIADQATYEEPLQPTTGMHTVLVNGTPIIEAGQPVLAERLPSTLPGRHLRFER